MKQRAAYIRRAGFRNRRKRARMRMAAVAQSISTTPNRIVDQPTARRQLGLKEKS